MNTNLNFDNSRPFSTAGRLGRGMIIAAIVAVLGVAGVGTVAAGGGTIDPNGNHTIAASQELNSPYLAVRGGGTVDPEVNVRPDQGNGRHANNDESEYLEELGTSFETLTDSIERFTDLLNDPDLGDEDSIDELTDILATWILASEDANALTPPDGYDEVHDTYLKFTAYLASAAFDIANGDMLSAVSNLEDAQEQAIELADLLEETTGDEDILDRRSGFAPSPIQA